jgi:hypothetical protein
VRDRPVTVEKEVMEDERSVRAVEDARGYRAPERSAGTRVSLRRAGVPRDAPDRRRQDGGGEAGEQQLEDACGEEGGPEESAQGGEAVSVERARIVGVLLVPALPDLRRSVGGLPREVGPVRRDVHPVSGREPRGPFDVRVLVRLRPEMPEGERGRLEGSQRQGADREDGDEDDRCRGPEEAGWSARPRHARL